MDSKSPVLNYVVEDANVDLFDVYMLCYVSQIHVISNESPLL